MTRYGIEFVATKLYSKYIEADTIQDAIESFESEKHIQLEERYLSKESGDKYKIISVWEEE
jgi:hypothetical protein